MFAIPVDICLVDEKLGDIRARIQPASKAAEAAIAEANKLVGPFFVWWNRITAQDVKRLREAVDDAKSEHDIQSFLNDNPVLLIQHLGGGHGRWVIPKKRLGAEYETDFIIGEKSSLGYEWMAVELENPHASVFTKKGDFTAELNHAIRQITDWRVWLRDNVSYADKPRTDNGLGLLNVDPELPGLILIGRRDEHRDRPEKRRNLKSRMGIEIHSYDWLIDRAQGRVDALAQSDADSHD